MSGPDAAAVADERAEESGSRKGRELLVRVPVQFPVGREKLPGLVVEPGLPVGLVRVILVALRVATSLAYGARRPFRLLWDRWPPQVGARPSENIRPAARRLADGTTVGVEAPDLPCLLPPGALVLVTANIDSVLRPRWVVGVARLLVILLVVVAGARIARVDD